MQDEVDCVTETATLWKRRTGQAFGIYSYNKRYVKKIRVVTRYMSLFIYATTDI